MILTSWSRCLEAISETVSAILDQRWHMRSQQSRLYSRVIQLFWRVPLQYTIGTHLGIVLPPHNSAPPVELLDRFPLESTDQPKIYQRLLRCKTGRHRSRYIPIVLSHQPGPLPSVLYQSVIRSSSLSLRPLSKHYPRPMSSSGRIE